MLGSSGGINAYEQPGSGGGAIRFVVNGTMTVNGVIEADGQAGGYSTGSKFL